NKSINLRDFINYFSYRYLGFGKVVLSIGSILVFQEDRRVVVWGSGILSKTLKFGNAKFLAVRGFRTIDKLKELNYNIPEVVGDPALLLPLVYQPKAKEKYKLGVIPHYIHYEELKMLNSENIKIINLLQNVEDVINDINACEYIISTSLHGVIVSHAYGIPSLWIEFDSANKLSGDNIKFEDYFSSVCLEPYKPFKLDLSNFNLEDIIQLFKSNNQILPSHSRIFQIQNDLINVAPFLVQDRYIKEK
ncbi:polysaccharide pyruvyl transferase family protein, partial [Mesoflavibacter zeaxanthinifaciens]|uniref:polysaccharide pyruvyl transferase family protein n=1 Tax=Mesoflavibacter zeaxanthinifaciens TaxID=393060 RepID=UPI003A95819D